jgi:hypothetical protein
MAQRLDLQGILVSILGSNNVYFQPPPSVKMAYPCIVYSRDDEDAVHADNKLYKRKVRYQVTVIDRDPDSSIPEKVSELPLCAYDRFYAAENLNHDVYKLFF